MLSDTKIKALLATGKPSKQHDEKGLWLDIRGKTQASWVLRYTNVTGKKAEVTVGPLKFFNCEQARKQAQEYRDEAINKKACPKEYRRQKQAEAALLLGAHNQMRFGDLVKAKIDVIAPHVTTEGQRKAWITSMQENRIGKIATLYPHEITREHCEQFLKAKYEGSETFKINGKPVVAAVVMADDMRERIAAVLRWARGPGKMILTPGWENPCVWPNVDQVFNRKGHEEESHAALPPEEVGGFVAQIRACQDEQVPAIALEWAIISTTRLNEACGALWSEIDLNAMTWTVPVSRLKVKVRGRKKAKPHIVPLTARHLELLALVKPPEGVTRRALFSCYNRDQPVSTGGARKVLNKLRSSAGEVTCHGFRASFKTWAASHKVSFQMPVTGEIQALSIYRDEWIEAALNHVKPDVYNRSPDLFLLERRTLMEAWASFCGVVQEPKVLQFPQARAA